MLTIFWSEEWCCLLDFLKNFDETMTIKELKNLLKNMKRKGLTLLDYEKLDDKGRIIE